MIPVGKKLILGSSSIHRQSVLVDAGISFEIMRPDINEKAIRSQNFEVLPMKLSEAKQEALLPKIAGLGKDVILVTADLVVICNGNLREKPTSSEEAMKFMKEYAHYPAKIVAALTVYNAENGRRVTDIDITHVHFKPIPDDVIEKFIETGDPYSRAGAFDHTNPLIKPYVESIKGTSESVKGMPVHLLKKLYEKTFEQY